MTGREPSEAVDLKERIKLFNQSSMSATMALLDELDDVLGMGE